MKYGLLHRLAVLEMLDDDSLQQFRRDAGIPDPFRIHHQDRSLGADAETGSFAALHALRSEEQILPLQELGEPRVDLSTPTIG